MILFDLTWDVPYVLESYNLTLHLPEDAEAHYKLDTQLGIAADAYCDQLSQIL